MSVSQVKSLVRIGTSRRGLNWKDERHRSPKALGDWSGVILSRVTSKSGVGIQDFDYDMLSKIYICNDLAWTCINLVSSTAALGKLKVRSKTDTGIHYLPDHPLQKVLDFPNTSMTQFDLIQAYVTHQLLFGTVTMILLRQDMTALCPVCKDQGEEDCAHKLYYDSESPVKQIMPVHPSNIEHHYVKTLGKVCMFYVPDLQSGKKYIIHPDNVITDPLYNTDVSWYGVSPTFLLKRWLDLDEHMTQQVNDFFENGAIPSMIVSLNPGTSFTYEDEPATLVEKMKENWMKNFSAKSSGSKSPAFVYGDIHVERLQEKIKETISKELYYEIQARVCATYGVPPTLYEMGLRYGAQRASAKQHEEDFYNRTISKILARLEKKVNQLVVPSYNDAKLEVMWDLNDMGIASFLIEKREKRIETHWLNGLITRNKAQILLGYEPDESELGDDYYRLTVMGDGNSSTSNQLDNNLRVPAEIDE